MCGWLPLALSSPVGLPACVYLCVVLWAAVRTMRHKNLHTRRRSICTGEPHSTGLRSVLEAGDVSGSLHNCRQWLSPLVQYRLIKRTRVSLPESPQGALIWGAETGCFHSEEIYTVHTDENESVSQKRFIMSVWVAQPCSACVKLEKDEETLLKVFGLSRRIDCHGSHVHLRNNFNNLIDSLTFEDSF